MGMNMQNHVLVKKSGHLLRAGLLLASAVSVLYLTSCALDTPTDINKAPITVSKETYRVSYSADKVGDADILALRDHYLKRGEGPVNVLVTYNPRSKENTAMNASNKAGKIKMAMKKMGATDVNVEILPVKDSGDTSKVEFSYDIYEAHAPEGCDLMGGIEGTETGITSDYAFGCSQDILLARQISNPQDLLGRTASHETYARRQVNWIPSYHDGIPNEGLTAISTTD